LLILGTGLVDAAADVSGQWAVTITAGGGKITGEASLQMAGEKVTGTIGPSGDATIPVEGTLEADRLTLKTKPRPGRTAAFETCEVRVTADKMTGTLQGGDVGKGDIEFVRAAR
jgi:hypothetical protein